MNRELLSRQGLLSRQLVSVYIPTYNRADLLRDRCLPSVLGQTHENLEVIVVAHGCTDHTAEVVRSFPDKRLRLVEIDRNIHYPDTPRNRWFAGRVEPSNRGLEECVGTWTATNDDDKIWAPHLVETLLEFAMDGGYDFVSAGAESHEGPIEPYDVDGVLVGSIHTWLYRDYLRWMKFDPNCWAKDWDRVCDTDLQRRFVHSGVRMGYLDRSLVKIYPRPGEKHIGSKAVF